MYNLNKLQSIQLSVDNCINYKAAEASGLVAVLGLITLLATVGEVCLVPLVETVSFNGTDCLADG